MGVQRTYLLQRDRALLSFGGYRILDAQAETCLYYMEGKKRLFGDTTWVVVEGDDPSFHESQMVASVRVERGCFQKSYHYESAGSSAILENVSGLFDRTYELSWKHRPRGYHGDWDAILFEDVTGVCSPMEIDLQMIANDKNQGRCATLVDVTEGCCGKTTSAISLHKKDNKTPSNESQLAILCACAMILKEKEDRKKRRRRQNM